MADIIRKGVTMKEAALEAAAIAPIGRAMLYAYELWHPSLAEPIYFVNDVRALNARIEATADRNAATIVEFIACPLSMQKPEESDSAENPKVVLSRNGISGLLSDALDAARGDRQKWELIEREYASDVLTGPAKLPPRKYNLDAAGMTQLQADFTASHADFANEGIPRATFRRDEYPGLDA